MYAFCEQCERIMGQRCPPFETALRNLVKYGRPIRNPRWKSLSELLFFISSYIKLILNFISILKNGVVRKKIGS